MQITYLYHSGFLAEMPHTVLIFDYYTGGGKHTAVDISGYQDKKIYIFVSHAHADHFDQAIFQWEKDVTYILSSDVSVPRDFKGRAIFMKPHEKTEVDGIEISTLQSNDEGVAFLVKAEGKTLYHGGDLNWWHWDGESEEFLEDIAKSYCGETDKLKGEEIDVAFIAADPRLEKRYDMAADYFMKKIGAKSLFPMHFWGDFSVCKKLKKKPYGTKIMALTKEGDSFSL